MGNAGYTAKGEELFSTTATGLHRASANTVSNAFLTTLHNRQGIVLLHSGSIDSARVKPPASNIGRRWVDEAQGSRCVSSLITACSLSSVATYNHQQEWPRLPSRSKCTIATDSAIKQPFIVGFWWMPNLTDFDCSRPARCKLAFSLFLDPSVCCQLTRSSTSDTASYQYHQ